MALPFLPGYSYDRNLGNTMRHRVQILDKRRGVPYTYDDFKLVKPKDKFNKKVNHDYITSDGPSWIVYDKKVLCFDGYWFETVVDNPYERYITRNCKLMYYLEDDTIQVLEPRIKNSSLLQGTVVQRRKILKPPPNDTEFYTVHDLNIGEVVSLCGRNIKLISCDKFTHNYLRHIGVQVPHHMEAPLDPRQITQILGSQKKGKGYYHSSDNLKQFIDHNKHILRFYCFWDNEDLRNDPRSMILYYFLEDDTIEIKEDLPINCGREGSLFMRRQKLPKIFTSCGLNFPSQLSDPGYLNVIKTSKFQHKIIDSLQSEIEKIECYKDNDLSIGQYINVLGRKFMICDCDEFTKEFYRQKYGITSFNSIDMSQYWKRGQNVEKYIAPYNGWGSEEDSILSCLSIRPNEIIKSGKKYMTTKRTIDDLMVLHFLAIIHKAENKFDKERRFIIAFRVEDDLLYINEQTNEKAGFNFVSFLNRGIYMKPKAMRKNIYVPEYYVAKDFYIGALIELQGLVLEIILTDDYTLKYMEKNAQLFHFSSLERILIKLRKYLSHSKADVEFFFKDEDPNNTGYVKYPTMKLFTRTFANDFLVPQETITLSRLYKDRQNQMSVDINRKIAKIRGKLRQNNFMDFYVIKEHWYAVSPHSTKLHISKARSILKGLQFPLSDEMICDLLRLSMIESTENIDLCKLLDIIEWQKFQPDYFEKVGKYLGCEEDLTYIENLRLSEAFPEKPFNIGNILWKNFVNDIYNPPKSSKSHPSTQRMMKTAHCIKSYE